MDDAVGRKIRTFFSQYQRQFYKRGENLIRADEDPTGVFYLKTGVVKEYAISQKGEELVVNLFKPVSFFPMSWAMGNSTNQYYYAAVISVEVWKAPRDAAVEFIKNEPDVLYDLLKRVYRGTDGLLMRMVYLMSGSARNRLIAEILIQAKRFGQPDTKTGAIMCKITEKDLAAHAGLTRETVSRELRPLKKEVSIRVESGKITIPDIHKLEELLSEDFSPIT